MKKYITTDLTQTQNIGQDLALQILSEKTHKNATVLALSGDLGAGKTTFLQGFAKGLGITENVLSPTFVIMKKFSAHNFFSGKKEIWDGSTHSEEVGGAMPTGKFKHFYHFDCYRLNSPGEILELGFEEIISNPENIVAIEWPEKLGDLLPQDRILITFNHLEESFGSAQDKNKREITIENF